MSYIFIFYLYIYIYICICIFTCVYTHNVLFADGTLPIGTSGSHVEEYIAAVSKGSSMGVHGIQDLVTCYGKMLILSCTSSYQTGAKYLKTGKQIPALDW